MNSLTKEGRRRVPSIEEDRLGDSPEAARSIGGGRPTLTDRASGFLDRSLVVIQELVRRAESDPYPPLLTDIRTPADFVEYASYLGSLPERVSNLFDRFGIRYLQGVIDRLEEFRDDPIGALTEEQRSAIGGTMRDSSLLHCSLDADQFWRGGVEGIVVDIRDNFQAIMRLMIQYNSIREAVDDLLNALSTILADHNYAYQLGQQSVNHAIQEWFVEIFSQPTCSQQSYQWGRRVVPVTLAIVGFVIGLVLPLLGAARAAGISARVSAQLEGWVINLRGWLSSRIRLPRPHLRGRVIPHPFPSHVTATRPLLRSPRPAGVPRGGVRPAQVRGTPPRSPQPAGVGRRGGSGIAPPVAMEARNIFQPVYRDLLRRRFVPTGRYNAIRPDATRFPTVEIRPNGDVLGSYEDLAGYLRTTSLTGRRSRSRPTIEAHHLIEDRLLTPFGIRPEDGRCVALTDTDHQIFTNEFLNYRRRALNYDIDEIFDASERMYLNLGHPEWVDEMRSFLREYRSHLRDRYQRRAIPGGRNSDFESRLERVLRFLENL